MFLSDLYEKDEIQESLDLINEIVSLAPARHANVHYQPSSRAERKVDTSHLGKKAVRMYPGNTGVFKRAQHHLLKAQKRLQDLDPTKDHDAQVYQELVQAIRRVKDTLIQYKGAKMQ